MKLRDAFLLSVNSVAMLGMVASLHACGGDEFTTTDEPVMGSGGDQGTGGGNNGGSGTGGSSTGGASSGGGGQGTGGASGSGGGLMTGGSGGVSTGGSGGMGTGGGTGMQCGTEVCGSDEYCCDASCSACAKIGFTCSCSGEPCGATTCAPGESCCDPQCGTCVANDQACLPGSCAVEDCGPVTCAPGEVCCDATCGLCAPTDTPCPVNACGTTVRCGRYSSCSEGELCCDATCGTCSFGGLCVATAAPAAICVPDCTAMEAYAVQGCTNFLGYKWNGIACQELRGCSCTGSQCDLVFETQEECVAAHAYCPTTTTP